MHYALCNEMRRVRLFAIRQDYLRQRHSPNFDPCTSVSNRHNHRQLTYECFVKLCGSYEIFSIETVQVTLSLLARRKLQVDRS